MAVGAFGGSVLGRRWDPWLAPILGLYVVLVGRFWFLCDDAYITFRYARNLARGVGITYNRGDAPVEGFSDFLWMLLAAAFEATGLSVEVFIPVVSAAIGLAFVVGFAATLEDRFGFDRWSVRFGTAALALSPAFAMWTTSGLEPMPFAAALFFLFDRWVLVERPDERTIRQAAAAAVVASLVRTEGAAWVMVFAGVAFVARWIDDPDHDARRALRPLARALAGWFVVFAVYTLWRYAYFGDWVPNTAHAKVGFTLDRVARGAKYVGLFWATFPTLLLAGVGAVPAMLARPGRGLAVVLVAAAFPLYGVAIGGDFMPMGRMLVPGIPFAVVLLTFAWDASRFRFQDVRQQAALAATLLVLGVLGGYDIHVVPQVLREQLHFRLSDKEFMSEVARWENMADNTDGFKLRGRALKAWAPRGTRLVSKAIGVQGYYSDLYIYDQYGLVNREVALLPTPPGRLVESPGHDKAVDAAFFVKYDPDLLNARLVQGLKAPGMMKDTLEEWDVPADLHSRFVPDFREVQLEGVEDRNFLLLVRRAEPWEDGPALWDGFADRRKALLADLKLTYGDQAEAGPGGSDPVD